MDIGWVLAFCLFWVGCSSVSRPCQDGGEPSRDKPFRGTRQCIQRKDPLTKAYVNDGRYVEWYPSGKKALEGQYKMGRKDGSWTEWDEEGRKLSEKTYDDGREVGKAETSTR